VTILSYQVTIFVNIWKFSICFPEYFVLVQIFESYFPGNFNSIRKKMFDLLRFSRVCFRSISGFSALFCLISFVVAENGRGVFLFVVMGCVVWFGGLCVCCHG
jgi:hypothetical protein